LRKFPENQVIAVFEAVSLDFAGRSGASSFSGRMRSPAMRRLPILSTFFVVLFTLPALADALLSQASGRYRIDAAKSRIGFSVAQVGGGGISGIVGEFAGRFEINGRDISRSKVEISIVPASVATGKKRVEAFLRGKAVLDAKRNPEVIFRSSKVTRTGPQSAVIEGLLSARGRKKPALFNVELVERAGRRIVFHVTGDIRRSPYDMQVGYPIYSNIVKFDMTLTGRRI
jgi:polyisoprenoid-binding protein YceI